MTKFLKDIFNPIRIILTVFFVLLLLFAAITIYLMFGSANTDSEVVFGITFSQLSAKEMGIDWQEAYSYILDNLGVKKLRLLAHWSIIEQDKGQYSFNDLDWQINEAKKREAEIVLVVGSKLPGSAGCYIPEWAKDLSEKEQQEQVLLFINEVIKRYSSESIIKIWQIEDKPFEKKSEECVKFDREFLNKEISLVRDSDLINRPVMLTASGEFGSWLKPAILADNLGISVYRNNWTQYLGYVNYPIKSVFYKKRADLTKFLTEIDNIIVIELQAEPKGPKPINEMSSIEWDRSMSLDKFKDTIDYVSRAGFDEVYLKGVEWWYYMKKEGNSSFWSEAQKLWSK